jgi:hypothetical protein
VEKWRWRRSWQVDTRRLRVSRARVDQMQNNFWHRSVVQTVPLLRQPRSMRWKRLSQVAKARRCTRAKMDTVVRGRPRPAAAATRLLQREDARHACGRGHASASVPMPAPPRLLQWRQRPEGKHHKASAIFRTQRAEAVHWHEKACWAGCHASPTGFLKVPSGLAGHPPERPLGLSKRPLGVFTSPSKRGDAVGSVPNVHVEG